MRNRILAAIAIVLVLLFAGTLILQGLPGETKDRLPPELLAEMVEGPMAAVRGRGLAEGDAAFERLVASERSDRVRIADLTMAYGVELYNEWWETKENRALLQASRERIRSSVPLYRAAFGPAHPEVALALNSFADVEAELNGETSAQAEAALREALKIRSDALGPNHKETIATERDLENIQAVSTGAASGAMNFEEEAAR